MYTIFSAVAMNAELENKINEATESMADTLVAIILTVGKKSSEKAIQKIRGKNIPNIIKYIVNVYINIFLERQMAADQERIRRSSSSSNESAPGTSGKIFT